jgi:uncharacterized protein (TIGR00369 family)
MQTFQAQLGEISAGQCEIIAPIVAGARQQQGFGHAGLTFALGDSAAGYAALTMIPPEQEVVTAEIKINLLAPAIGDQLRAVGRVIKPGRRIHVVQSDVYAIKDGVEKHIAILQGPMMRWTIWATIIPIWCLMRGPRRSATPLSGRAMSSVGQIGSAG